MFNLPNILTIARLLLLFPFFYYLAITDNYKIAFLLLFVAGLTDWLDGKIARWLNQQSDFGAFIDPLVDRVYMLIVPIAMAVSGILSWWIVVLLFARELFLLPSFLLLQKNGFPPLKVTYLGKAATFALMSALPLILAAKVFTNLEVFLAYSGYAFLLWGLFFYWWTFVSYWRKTLFILKVKN